MSDITVENVQNVRRRVMSREELIELQREMSRKAKRKKRARTGALIGMNILVSLIILLPLL